MRRLSQILVFGACLCGGTFFFSACGEEETPVSGPPSITGFEPLNGHVGDEVIITGMNFSSILSSNTVKFHGTNASVASATPTQVIVTVPPGATSGVVTVTVNDRVASSPAEFTVTVDATPVTVTGFTPMRGPVGTMVTLKGDNFSTSVNLNKVKFDNAEATVTAATKTQLTVLVPARTTTGKISVTLNGVTATAPASFAVTTESGPPPAIISFSPAYGYPGSTVKITGSNFNTTASNNTVTFNGATAAVTAVTPVELTVMVPADATTGKISVTLSTHATTATSSAEYTVIIPSACKYSNTVEQVACLAAEFKKLLTAEQVAALELPLNIANAERWSAGACSADCRNGLTFNSLNTAQLIAAKAVIQASISAGSNEGYHEFEQINSADDVLATQKSGYSSGYTTIAFLGTPTTTGKWLLQFGGHNYVQNITYEGGKVVSITPAVQSVEPVTWTTNGTTNAPLTSEHDVMAGMLATLTAEELAAAYISDDIQELLMLADDAQAPATKQGLRVGSLSLATQAKVKAAIAPWMKDFDVTASAAFTNLYYGELANTYICYAGNANGTAGVASSFLNVHGDYVRIDGPSLWIEFIVVNGEVYPDQISYHSVMRDHKRDYLGL